MAWWTQQEQGPDPYGIWGARKQALDLFKKNVSQQGGTSFLSLLSNLASRGGEESGGAWTGLTGQGGIQDKMAKAAAEEEARTAFQAKQMELDQLARDEEKRRWEAQWKDYQKGKGWGWLKGLLSLAKGGANLYAGSKGWSQGWGG